MRKKIICEWLRGNFAKNFPRPLSFFWAITWPTELQIGWFQLEMNPTNKRYKFLEETKALKTLKMSFIVRY